MKTKSEIFKAAHELAKSFEGDYVARLSEGLRIAYAESKFDSKLAEKSVKEIFTAIYLFNSNGFDIEAETILDTVKNNSKGFQKNIAENALKYGRLTEKQAWCVAYEFKNVA